MIEEAAKHLSGETSIEKMYFVLFDDDAHKIFESTAREIGKA
jgi:hypothetical protein